MRKKYIKYHRGDVYAIYYRANRTMYYNLAFQAKTKLILLL